MLKIVIDIGINTIFGYSGKL